MSEQTSTTAQTDAADETAQVENEQAEVTEDEQVEQEFDDLTPYAAAQVMTLVTGNEVSEQTYYGYARSGSIASNYQAWLRDGGKKSGYKVKFDGNAFKQHLDGVVSGKIQPSSRGVDYARLAAEFTANAEAE
jgi:hypothetical protein